MTLESCFIRNDMTKVEAPIEEFPSRKVQKIKKFNIETLDDPKLLIFVLVLKIRDFIVFYLFK